MRVRKLRTYPGVPDLADHVIHFTGRKGRRTNVDERIEQLSAQARLLYILLDRKVRGFETFGSTAPVVCLTESTRAAVTALIGADRYEPCGIGFSKQFAFERKGGPALYVRGDEWPSVGALPHPLRSRVVRFWPGADLDTEESLLPHLSGTSEWLHEREWRVPGDLSFQWGDVEFLIVDHPSWQHHYAGWIATWADEAYAQWFSSIPAVVMGADGRVIQDGRGIWT
jgi:hypothetical protein